jgi:hypothetical protein
MVASRSSKIVTLINEIMLNIDLDNRAEINSILTKLSEIILSNVAEMKEMFHRNKVEEYFTFLSFLFGIKG